MTTEKMYAAIPGSPVTTLDGSHTDSITTISVADATILPDPGEDGQIVTIYDLSANKFETIHYTGKSGNDLTGCHRGWEGDAQSWDGGEKVARLITAYDHNRFIIEIDNLSTNLDGGRADTAYGGMSAIDGGDASGS